MAHLVHEFAKARPGLTGQRVTGMLGVLVLSESITVTALAGIALVLMGVALTRRRMEPASGEHRVE